MKPVYESGGRGIFGSGGVSEDFGESLLVEEDDRYGVVETEQTEAHRGCAFGIEVSDKTVGSRVDPGVCEGEDDQHE